MLQIEVKYFLIKNKLNPIDGWKVSTHLDPMELGKGNQNKPEKKEIASKYLELLKQLGVTVKVNPIYGKIDIVAEKDGQIHFIEVEGDTSKQPEQAFYSMLGQLMLSMKSNDNKFQYGLAVPNSSKWKDQLTKLPEHLKESLRINFYFVSEEYSIVSER